MYWTDDWQPNASYWEGRDEADQWAAREEVVAWVKELYGGDLPEWQLDELVDAGEDALNGCEDWGFEWTVHEEIHSDRILSRHATALLTDKLAEKWAEQEDWQRRETGATRQQCHAHLHTARRVGVRARSSRRSAPRRRRGSRRTTSSRAGPDDDPGEPEPPGLGQGGASQEDDFSRCSRTSGRGSS